MSLYEQAGAPRQLADAYRRMAELYKQRGDTAKGFEMLDRAWKAVERVNV
jgi:hypothetical protein